MKQDKYNPSIYWHGGKMYFTGGGLPLMQGAMGGESVQSDLPGIMNTPAPGLQPSSQVGSNRPITPQGSSDPSMGKFNSALGLAGMGVDMIAKPGSTGASVAPGVLKGVTMGAALGPIGMGAGALLGGVSGLISSNKAKKEQSMLDEQRSRDAYAAGTRGISSDAHIYAYGGNFAQGGITPRLTEFNEGGSHEQNADGGVAQGANTENGEPNLVEQGETKFKDYIFSDRLTMPNAREYNLGGHLNGLTFATISKKLSKSTDERPNDPISKAGQDKALERLRMANDDAIEEKKFSDENESFKCGGMMKISKKNKFEYGGYTFTDI